MYSVVLDLVGLYPSFLSLSHNNHRRRLEKDENPMTSYYCFVVDVAGCFSEINHTRVQCSLGPGGLVSFFPVAVTQQSSSEIGER